MKDIYIVLFNNKIDYFLLKIKAYIVFTNETSIKRRFMY